MNSVSAALAEERQLFSGSGGSGGGGGAGDTGGSGTLFYFYPESARVKCQAFLREAAP